MNFCCGIEIGLENHEISLVMVATGFGSMTTLGVFDEIQCSMEQ